MNSEEAIDEIRKRYFEGEREIHVTPELFKAYGSSVQTLTRLSGPIRPPRPRQELCFKDAIVWTEKDSN